MRTANIGTLKNQLSAYLRLVRNGEEVIVCDRNVPVARLVPLAPEIAPDGQEDYAAEEARLIAAGVLKAPLSRKPMDWEAFWAIPTGTVSDEAVTEAINWSKGEY